MYIVGGTLALLAFTPLPTMICLVYAVLFIAVGRAMEVKMEDIQIESEVDEEEESAEEIRRPENVVSLLRYLAYQAITDRQDGILLYRIHNLKPVKHKSED